MELARTKYGRSAGLAQVMGETGRFGNTPELTLAQNLHLSSPLLTESIRAFLERASTLVGKKLGKQMELFVANLKASLQKEPKQVVCSK